MQRFGLILYSHTIQNLCLLGWGIYKSSRITTAEVAISNCKKPTISLLHCPSISSSDPSFLFLTLSLPPAMTKRQLQRRPQQPAWSMFPSLHDDVSRLLEVKGHSFTCHNVDNEIDCTRSYDTAIMAKFCCRSQKCQSKIWSSKKVAITIRMYPGEQYNARVYHQHCKVCNALSKPILDDSYAERVTYRLLKWSGVEQDRPVFSGESRGPHRRELCEGCIAGYYAEGGRIDGLLTQFSNFSIGGT